MIDIKLLREKPDFVRDRLRVRGFDSDSISPIIDLDVHWRSVVSEAEDLQATLNRQTKTIGLMMRESKLDEAESIKQSNRTIGDQIALLKERARLLASELDDLLYVVPNLPHESTPEGGEANNVIIKHHGDLKEFNFVPLPHWDIAANLDIIDFNRGAKLAGSGFTLYKGLGALIQRALIHFMIDYHLNRHGYLEWSTPYFLSRESVKASGHLAKFLPEMYHDVDDDLFALPTAEPALVNIHRDEILDGKNFPLKYVAHSPCWRREAGAAGKDTRGLLRVHQFDKVEMVKYTTPETSYEELDSMLTDATDVLESLELPYRVKLLAGGDISFASAKTYDIEAYAPGVGSWLEVSSCSNCEDYQSRQGNVRFRREVGSKPEFAHLLNGSGLALPRVLASLLETHQQIDGTVSVPPALQPYLGGRTALQPVSH